MSLSLAFCCLLLLLICFVVVLEGRGVEGFSRLDAHSPWTEVGPVSFRFWFPTHLSLMLLNQSSKCVSQSSKFLCISQR